VVAQSTSSAESQVADLSPKPLDLFPSVIGAFQEHGYDAGYARGVNDTHIALLEAINEFSRLHRGSPGQTQELLYAFSEFLERTLLRSFPRSGSGFIDGAGI
jgi:hypothetical protein